MTPVVTAQFVDSIGVCWKSINRRSIRWHRSTSVKQIFDWPVQLWAKIYTIVCYAY